MGGGGCTCYSPAAAGGGLGASKGLLPPDAAPADAFVVFDFAAFFTPPPAFGPEEPLPCCALLPESSLERCLLPSLPLLGARFLAVR